MRPSKYSLALALAATAAASHLIAQQPPQTPADPLPALLRNYTPVTAERLLHPEDANVLMVRGTYDGWGYSPLKGINTSNVSRLQPVWSFSTGQNKIGRAHV